MTKSIVRLDRATSFKMANRLKELAAGTGSTKPSKATVLNTLKREFSLDIQPKTLSRLAEDAEIKPFWSEGEKSNPLTLMNKKITAMKEAVVNIYNRTGETLPDGFLDVFTV